MSPVLVLAVSEPTAVLNGAALEPIQAAAAESGPPGTCPPAPSAMAPRLAAVPAVRLTSPVPADTVPLTVMPLPAPPAASVTPAPVAASTVSAPLTVWTLSAPPVAAAVSVTAPALFTYVPPFALVVFSDDTLVI